MTKNIILIFGSSGSGSTTMARAIAETYGYHFIDSDDCIWKKTDPPFTHRRSDEKAWDLLNEEIDNHEKIVISGSIVCFGDPLKPMIDLIVYMDLPLDVRLKRIQKREQRRFGDRVKPGGDLYEQHLDFLEWVSKYDELGEDVRSKKQHLKWIEDMDVPTVTIQDMHTVDELLDIIDPHIEAIEKGDRHHAD